MKKLALKDRLGEIRLSSFQPLVALAAGLALSLLIVSLAGENPAKIFMVLVKSTFASRYDLGMMLFYSTPLILCGLSVSMAHRAGLFNVGAEGQLLMGALGAAICGIYFQSLPWPLAPLLAIAFAFVFGAAWASIAGALRVTRGSHEVITTIMLNFVASALCAWFVLNPLKDPQVQNPETYAVAPAYLLKKFSFFDGAPVTFFVIATLFLVYLVQWIYRSSRFGFEAKCVGLSETASFSAGIKTNKVRFVSFLIAGGLAGLVGASEVLGNAGRFKLDFSPGFGFTGIAVALLARGNPWGILFSGLLFGALHKGSLDLDIETDKVTREVSMVIQGLIILSVSADGLWQWMHRPAKNAKGKVS